MKADAGRLERKFNRVALEARDGRIAGYASVFGTVDLGRDLVERGAFAKSLERRGPGGIRMLFQHDPAQPIGRWTAIREDARGLHVEGRISTEVAKGREVLALLRSGGLDGLSIGFRTVRARKDTRTGVRRIIEADLWEISVVTFPMHPEARVTAVKGGRLPTEREFERRLVRDAGLTRSEARAVIAKGFAELRRRRDGASAERGLAETIRAAAHTLQQT
ncbi:HK97 family phage prohead protease [Oricola thermophila]|uniref:HK97 family phage prohead protease n=1 Tax=Oricola thermophila TaxID=2742145 RepID=A0A6N1VCA1_9HYPH|nr:HK97 family phage prohead protease [Oricola thermophila]QKV18636.1 HK97 family phage prohead protease [Oricola thermophila]